MSKALRVIVCGGRRFNDPSLIWRTLDNVHAGDYNGEHIKLVIDGASDETTGPYTGADYWAHQWACARDVPTIRQHANWKAHGRAAGPIRNGDMLALAPDLVIAFPGGNGTRDMMARAALAGVPVMQVRP